MLCDCNTRGYIVCHVCKSIQRRAGKSSIRVFIFLWVTVRLRLLVHLVLGHQVVQAALRLPEVVLRHPLAEVPVQKRLPPEHTRVRGPHPRPQLSDRRGVGDESHRHLHASRRNIAHRRLDVIRNPLHEVRAVLVLDVEHLLVHLLDGEPAPEDRRHGQVLAVAGVARGHQVLGVEHLLDEVGDGERPVGTPAPRGQRREPRHEEVQPRERHHVDGQLAQVGVELPREAQAGRDPGHGQRHQVVEVGVRRAGQAESALTDVVQRLVVNAEGLVARFGEVVQRQDSVVRFNDNIRHLRQRGEHAFLLWRRNFRLALECLNYFKGVAMFKSRLQDFKVFKNCSE